MRVRRVHLLAYTFGFLAGVVLHFNALTSQETNPPPSRNVDFNTVAQTAAPEAVPTFLAAGAFSP